jgi:hypothetical protein
MLTSMDCGVRETQMPRLFLYWAFYIYYTKLHSLYLSTLNPFVTENLFRKSRFLRGDCFQASLRKYICRSLDWDIRRIKQRPKTLNSAAMAPEHSI